LRERAGRVGQLCPYGKNKDGDVKSPLRRQKRRQIAGATGTAQRPAGGFAISITAPYSEVPA
jgi:hypothetical protein